MRADLSKIAGGLSCNAENLRQRVYNLDVVFNELRADLERLQKYDTLPLLLLSQKNRASSEAQAEEPANLTGPNKVTQL